MQVYQQQLEIPSLKSKYAGDASYGFSIGATADIHSEDRLHLCNIYFQFTCLDFLFYIL